MTNNCAIAQYGMNIKHYGEDLQSRRDYLPASPLTPFTLSTLSLPLIIFTHSTTVKVLCLPSYYILLFGETFRLSPLDFLSPPLRSAPNSAIRPPDLFVIIFFPLVSSTLILGLVPKIQSSYGEGYTTLPESRI
jgi:hypothetical protein